MDGWIIDIGIALTSKRKKKIISDIQNVDKNGLDGNSAYVYMYTQYKRTFNFHWFVGKNAHIGDNIKCRIFGMEGIHKWKQCCKIQFNFWIKTMHNANFYHRCHQIFAIRRKKFLSNFQRTNFISIRQIRESVRQFWRTPSHCYK